MLPDLVTVVPGPRSLALAQRLRAAESRNVTYTDPEFPVFWESAAGTNVWDVDGNRFLDVTAAFAAVGKWRSSPAPATSKNTSVRVPESVSARNRAMAGRAVSSPNSK